MSPRKEKKEVPKGPTFHAMPVRRMLRPRPPAAPSIDEGDYEQWRSAHAGSEVEPGEVEDLDGE